MMRMSTRVIIDADHDDVGQDPAPVSKGEIGEAEASSGYVSNS